MLEESKSALSLNMAAFTFKHAAAHCAGKRLHQEIGAALVWPDGVYKYRTVRQSAF